MISRIEALAIETFEDADKAARWLRTPLWILDRRTPLEVASTESGAALIEQILAKITWRAAA